MKCIGRLTAISIGVGMLWGITWCPVQAVSATAIRQWMTASQAFRKQQYREAHEAYLQIKDIAELPASLAEELLWNDACCLQQLGQPTDAAKKVETLLHLAPRSGYAAKARPLLYQYYLSTGALSQAEALWQNAITGDGPTAVTWPFVPVFLQYVMRDAPDRLNEAADRMSQFTVDSVKVSQALYQPQLQQLQFTEARTFHERLQAVLAVRHPAMAAIEQQAYDETLSQAILQTVSTRFTTALTAGDLDAALTWLTVLNTQAPEHPLAVQARQAYQQARQRAAAVKEH